MNAETYSSEALKLEGDTYDPHLIDLFLPKALTAVAEVGEVIDTLKRRAFYTIKPSGLVVDKINPFHCGTDQQADLSCISHRVIHAILGIISEAAEMATELNNAIAERREVDLVNMLEERGDQDWYQNLLDDALGFSQAQVWRGNIGKLKARYLNKANPQANGHDTTQRNKAHEYEAMSAAANEHDGNSVAADAEAMRSLVSMASHLSHRQFSAMMQACVDETFKVAGSDTVFEDIIDDMGLVRLTYDPSDNAGFSEMMAEALSTGGPIMAMVKNPAAAITHMGDGKIHYLLIQPTAHQKGLVVQ